MLNFVLTQHIPPKGWGETPSAGFHFTRMPRMLSFTGHTRVPPGHSLERSWDSQPVGASTPPSGRGGLFLKLPSGVFVTLDLPQPPPYKQLKICVISKQDHSGSHGESPARSRRAQVSWTPLPGSLVAPALSARCARRLPSSSSRLRQTAPPLHSIRSFVRAVRLSACDLPPGRGW